MRQTTKDTSVVNLLQEDCLNVDDSGKSLLESSLLHNLSLASQDSREFTFQPVSPAAYTSHHGEPPHMRLPGYPISTSCSDFPLQQHQQHVAAKLPPSMMSQIPPPSLTLQPPTSPPCVQSFEDDFHPPASPSDVLSQYGFNSSLPLPGLAWHYSQSPASLSPQPTFQAAGSPCSIEQVSPSCYKRHLSLPTSPSQPIVSKFNFLTPPLRSPAATHRSTSPAPFPLSPHAVSPIPFGSPNAVMSSPSGGTAHRQMSASSSLLPPASPRHMLTVPMGSSPCRSPTFFGPSLQPYQHSRSRSPSPISEFGCCC